VTAKLLKSNERGVANHGWLKSYHTFSFADYHNPKMMGFRSLRVINEDHIDGGQGFSTHGHRDMEIITYVVSGSLQHKDTLGNTAVIKPGEVQTMTAGTGIRHSEFNASATESAHLLQIWILPDREGHQPGYGQMDFFKELAGQGLVLVTSPTGEKGSIAIHQNAMLYAAKWSEARQAELPFQANRYAWIQLIQGELQVNGHSLQAGDGLALSELEQLQIRSSGPAEFLLFDLE
jgi:redox-sensitive bicupin YhaK (pirin superfamily)